ncbi:hypothetical protein [Ideonella sp.]|uniref:COG4315 family predicted lipoprotein n=1 Tax=Ideonella sp. TaxID=1929293 RepID=UPI00351B9EC4
MTQIRMHTGWRLALTTGVMTGLMAVAGLAQAAAPAFSKGALVGPNGMTLYTFDKDTAGSGKSVCNGPCAKLWPPLVATAGDTPSGDYTLLTRDDGAKQWAFKGKPLYYYEADKAAGERSGDKFKDVWHIIPE